MKNRKVRRTFSKEFKSESVRMLATRSLTEVAESLGVTQSLLSRWKAAAASEGGDAFRGNGKRTVLEEENRQLRKRVADLEEEKDILKKAAAYFARYQK
jgi:transposase